MSDKERKLVTTWINIANAHDKRAIRVEEKGREVEAALLFRSASTYRECARQLLNAMTTPIKHQSLNQRS